MRKRKKAIPTLSSKRLVDLMDAKELSVNGFAKILHPKKPTEARRESWRLKDYRSGKATIPATRAMEYASHLNSSAAFILGHEGVPGAAVKTKRRKAIVDGAPVEGDKEVLRKQRRRRARKYLKALRKSRGLSDLILTKICGGDKKKLHPFLSHLSASIYRKKKPIMLSFERGTQLEQALKLEPGAITVQQRPGEGGAVAPAATPAGGSTVEAFRPPQRLHVAPRKKAKEITLRLGLLDLGTNTTVQARIEKGQNGALHILLPPIALQEGGKSALLDLLLTE